MTTLPTLGEWHPIQVGDEPSEAPTESVAVPAVVPQPVPAASAGPRPEDAQKIADLEREIRDLRAKAEKSSERKEKTKPGFDGWSLRIALAATIGLTASGEFALAQLAGWARELAWLLPVAIDVYVVQAFRRHRDVAQALVLMVLANAVYHLASAGLFGVDAKERPEWWLIVGVAAIAPFVMWRIHRMSAPRRERRQQLPERPASVPAERHQEAAQALTDGPGERAHENVDERAHEAPGERSPERPDERRSERESERGERPKSERARRSSGGRRERAQKKTKKSAAVSAGKNLSALRRERARRLYDELGRRPEWTEIRDVLVAEKLADKDVSRPTIQRVRDAIEREEPALAALGTDNVRALTNDTKTA